MTLPFHVTVDGNGNVMQLVDADSGSVAAAYEYDPYGNTISATGPDAAANNFRYQTKYWDAETGLSYYGFRYYSPTLGRWLSRDPIGETGGIGLYVHSFNNAMSWFDLLGMQGCEVIIYVGHNADVQEAIRGKSKEFEGVENKRERIRFAGIACNAKGDDAGNARSINEWIENNKYPLIDDLPGIPNFVSAESETQLGTQVQQNNANMTDVMADYPSHDKNKQGQDAHGVGYVANSDVRGEWPRDQYNKQAAAFKGFVLRGKAAAKEMCENASSKACCTEVTFSIIFLNKPPVSGEFFMDRVRAAANGYSDKRDSDPFSDAEIKKSGMYGLRWINMIQWTYPCDGGGKK